jgi:hypothetical protein
VSRVPGELPQADRLAAVDEAFRSMPDRYLGAGDGCDTTYQVRLCDLGRTWEVRCTGAPAGGARGGVGRGPPRLVLPA